MNAGWSLRVENISKIFDDGSDGPLSVLDRVSFEVAPGELLSLVGPSGCGKTTLLEIIAGLQRPTSGRSLLAPVSGAKGAVAGRAVLVFQDYTRSLYPFMTVHGNIQFALETTPLGRSERSEREREVLDAMGLRRFMDYFPWQLSGGMQQRVAVARALAVRPSVLLLDEPFAAVDRQTQYRLEDEVVRLSKMFALSVVYVTHDLDSAVYCGKRVLVIGGRPAQLRDEFQVELQEPRTQEVTRASLEFGVYRTRVYNVVREWVGHGDQ